MSELYEIMIKISFILPNLRGGGAERVMVNLANSFLQRGYAVDFVLLSASGVFLQDLLPGVHVIDLKVRNFRSAMFPLMRYFRRVRPTAVLACMWPLTFIAVCARLLARISTRLIVAEHCTWSHSELIEKRFHAWLVPRTMHYMFPFADAIVTVSEKAADDLANFAGINRKTITTIYNPVVGNVETTPINLPHSLRQWWSGTHYKLLAVGNLKKIKDYSTMLKAIAILRQKVDIRLLILGEGEERSALSAQAEQLGLVDHIFMPGFVKDPAPFYQRADLYLLSSISEGLPTVIIEALAAGTPVVSTDCPSGPREILCDGLYGQLVPVGNAIALADAIETSLSMNHDTAPLKIRAQDFSVDRATNQYSKLFFPSNVKKHL